MADQEFESGEPLAPTRGTVAHGERAPEAGRYVCCACDDPAVAAEVMLACNEVAPLCHTCGPLTNWVRAGEGA